MKKNWRTYFSGKRITLMGLGLLGRGINVAKFLLENGTELTITDLKPKERLLPSLAELSAFEKQITYVLGEHRLEDFRGRDLIIKTAGVPLESIYVGEAHNDREKAIDFAINKLARKGDWVLFLGKGHEKSMNIAGVETAWDEVSIVKEKLK